MLDIRLDDEQRMLVEAINRFAAEKLRQTFREAEETGIIPQEVIQAGWEIGWLPTAIPEAYGGFGEHSAVTGALAMEALAHGDLALTLQIMVPNLVAVPLMLFGTEAQKAAHLPHFAAETPPPVTAALIEPVYQFDPRRLKTTAIRDGDEFLLNGTKAYVPLASTANTLLVYADLEGQTQAFLVERAATGVSVLENDKLMGVQALQTSKIALTDVRIPADAQIGGKDGINFDNLLNRSRVALAAAAVGMANACFEYARDYTKQRVQFGKPVAQNQSIAFMLADMASDVESMRMLVWEAAWKLDQGHADVTAATVVMKHFVDQAVLRVADSGVLALGGYGYIREYPVELWLRNARGFATFDGLAMI